MLLLRLLGTCYRWSVLLNWHQSNLSADVSLCQMESNSCIRSVCSTFHCSSGEFYNFLSSFKAFSLSLTVLFANSGSCLLLWELVFALLCFLQDRIN